MTSTLPEDTDGNDDWREKRKGFSRFTKDKPKITKGIKGTAPKRKRLGNPRGRELWEKIKENRLLIGMFFIIILLFSMVIVILNLGWVINVEGDDINVDTGEDVEEVEGIIYRSVNETTTITDLDLISKQNDTGIYFKTNITDHRFLRDYDNLVNFTVDISFITNTSIDSNQFTNEGVGLWNFTSSSFDYKPVTITGNYSNSFDYTSNDYLNKTTHSNTTIRFKFQTSNEVNDFSFILIVNISGYFSVNSTVFPVEFEDAIQYNSIVNFTISGFCYIKTNTSDFLFLRDYDNLVNFTVDISFITNISIDSYHYINESIGLWNFTSSSFDYEPITITGNYSNSFNYTSNDYLNKTTHTNTTIRFKLQTSNEVNDYSFALDVNISAWFSVDPTVFPPEYIEAIDPSVNPNGFRDLVDGRYYTPKYYDGYVVNGLETTHGVETYLAWDGNYKPESERSIKYKDKSFYNGTYYDDELEEWVYGDNKTYINYEVDVGSFKVEFTNTSNTITTSKFSFKQLPAEIGLYNWDTQTYIKKEDVSKAEEILPDFQEKSLTYKEIFTNTDVKFTSNGTDIKEVFINDGTSFWNYPSGWDENATYLVIFTKLYDFEGIELYDDDGKIIASKVVNGIIRLKSTEVGQDILAYLPIGQAWSNFTDEEFHYTPVKDRIVFRGGDIYHVGAIDYQFVKHIQRVGEFYIDPTWRIGSGGEAWGDCSFNQTMINQTTNYVQLIPNNSTGNFTSPIGEAQLEWVKIQFDGSLNGESVDIYWNGSANDIDWEMDLVQSNALIKTNYSFPNPSKYGKWRLVLHGTSSPFNTPEIYNVTVFNDPPNSDDFRYYKIIEIDSAKVNGSGNHTNFPILISLSSDPDLKYDVQSNGDDIAFSNSTHWLDHEIELFNKSIGKLVVWIRIPSLSTSVNTTIYMYYGNSTMGSQENPTGVWNPSYMGVWHLNELSGDALDSTSYSTSGTLYGGIDQGTSGKIDGSYDFDGIDGEVNIGDPIDDHLDFGSGNLTVSFWLNIQSDTGDYQLPIFKGASDSSENGYDFETNQDGTEIHLNINDGSNGASSDSVWIYEGVWIYLVGVIDRSTDKIRIYDDGEQYGSGVDISSVGDIDSSEDLLISRWANPSDAIIDEVRLSASVHSADWIETEYNNQYDPNTFFTISLEQEKPVKTDFYYYREIEIDSAKVIGSWNLTDFPLLIHFSSDYALDYFVQDDADDILFSQDNGTTWLDHEIESFDNSTGELFVWVRIPSLSPSINTTIWIYYGNENMTKQENPIGVWNSGYRGIYHLNNDPTGTIIDSTVNSKDGVSYGSMDSDDLINGQINGALEFDGSDKTIDLGDWRHETDFDADLGTVSFWMNRAHEDEVSDDHRIFEIYEASDYRIYLEFDSSPDQWEFTHEIDDQDVRIRRDATDIPKNDWIYVSMTWDVASDILKIYINGSFVVSETGLQSCDSDYLWDDVWLASSHDDSEYYEGSMDEFRISDTVRNASWIETEFNNQDDPNTFYSIGSLQSLLYYEYINITDHKFFDRDWNNIVNFTVSFEFTTNISITSFSYLNQSLAIWNFTSSSYNYDVFSYTIIGNFTLDYDFTSKDFLNQTLTNKTNARIGVFTSNANYNYTFNLIVNTSGYFQNATIYYPDELEIGDNFYNNFIEENPILDFEKSNITDHRFLRDWDTLLNFTVSFEFTSNISIDSEHYANESLGIWNFTASSWDYSMNYTITGDFTSSYDFTSKDFLNQTSSSQTNVRIGVFSSNEVEDFTYTLVVNVSGYFQNATIHYSDDFEITTNFYNNFTEWDNITLFYYDKDYHKNISYIFKFDTKWIDINYLIVSFNITLNRTIDSNSYQNNGTQLWDVTHQEWDSINNITFTGDDSYYFEINPAREYLTKISNSTTYFKLILFMSNLDYDFTYSVSIQVIAWYWEEI